MAIAYASGATANNNTGSAVTGSLGTTVAGQLIVITIVDDSSTTASVTSVTDNKGNTYQKVDITATNDVLANSCSVQMWYAVLTSAGASHTVTVGWSTAATGRVTVAAQYFNGFTGTPTIDKTASAIGTSTTANPGTTAATSNANELVVVGAGHDGLASAFSLGSGYTNLTTVNQANAAVAQESKVVSSTGTQTGSLSIAASRSWGAIIATFYDSAGATKSGTAAVAVQVGVTAAGETDHSGTAAVAIGIAVAAAGPVTIPPVYPTRTLSATEILVGNRTTSYYYELLDNNDSAIGRLDGVTDGHLDWVANAMVKGAGDLTVVDNGQSINWLTARIRPVMAIDGLAIQPLGVFLASEAPESYDRGKTWAVKLLDKTTILDQDTVGETYALDAGSVVTDEIVVLIESAGIYNHAITPSAATLPGALVWEAGTSKLRIINDLLGVLNYFSLYANFDGQMIGEPYILPARRPLVYEFIDGRNCIYQPNFGRDSDIWSIPNRLTVTSVGDGETPALSSTYDNTDPSSPYSIANRGRVIGRVESGVEIADQTTLDDYTQRRLVDLTSPTAGVIISHSPIPGLAVNNAARFRRIPASIDARHVVSKTSLTLQGEALAKTTLREVVDL